MLQWLVVPGCGLQPTIMSCVPVSAMDTGVSVAFRSSISAWPRQARQRRAPLRQRAQRRGRHATRRGPRALTPARRPGLSTNALSRAPAPRALCPRATGGHRWQPGSALQPPERKADAERPSRAELQAEPRPAALGAVVGCSQANPVVPRTSRRCSPAPGAAPGVGHAPAAEAFGSGRPGSPRVPSRSLTPPVAHRNVDRRRESDPIRPAHGALKQTARRRRANRARRTAPPGE